MGFLTNLIEEAIATSQATEPAKPAVLAKLSRTPLRLQKRTRYLQIALNRTLADAARIISTLPISNRIILEAGTPLIKRHGLEAIQTISALGASRFGQPVFVVADLKTMDRGATEVEMAATAGASGVVALGAAPLETLEEFLKRARDLGLTSFIDMMNIEFPLEVLGQLRHQPDVVILHRGVDETTFNKEKPIPYYAIQRIKGTYNTRVAIAGGDTAREAQRAVFNGADIVITWQSFYEASGETAPLAETFLHEVK